MTFNFSSLLNGSLRIINIANKALPLIKEVSPMISNIKGKYQNNFNYSHKKIKELPYKQKEIKKDYYQNNNLPTFFK